MKTAAERKADERERYKLAGLVPVTVHVLAEDRPVVRALEQWLQAKVQPKKATAQDAVGFDGGTP